MIAPSRAVTSAWSYLGAGSDGNRVQFQVSGLVESRRASRVVAITSATAMRSGTIYESGPA